jgi:hypothetical protein
MPALAVGVVTIDIPVPVLGLVPGQPVEGRGHRIGRDLLRRDRRRGCPDKQEEEESGGA